MQTRPKSSAFIEGDLTISHLGIDERGQQASTGSMRQEQEGQDQQEQDREIDQLETASLRDSTLRAYDSSWRRWESHCQSRGIEPIPAGSREIMRWLLQQHREAGMAHETLMKRWSSIRAAHRQQGMELEGTERVQTFLRNLARKSPLPRREAAPILIEQIGAWIEAQDPSRMDQALALLCWHGAFRRSEIVSLDWSHHRKANGWIRVLPPNDEGETYMIVYLVRTKTTAHLTKSIRAMSQKEIDRGAHCPLRALRAWRQQAEANGIYRKEAPIFVGARRRERLNDEMLSSLAKRIASSAGKEAERYSGHSFRAGFVTQALLRGARADEVQAKTHHRSIETVYRYLRRTGKGAEIDRLIADQASQEEL